MLTFGLIALSNLCWSQSIVLKDTAFASVLCEKFPLAMVDGCEKLDTIASKSAYSGVYEMRLNGRGIVNADEVVYFTEADSIWLGNNDLTSFPSDLSMFRSLGRLSLFGNQLTEAPDIQYTNIANVDTAVKLVYLQDNLITALSASWSQVNSKTLVVDLKDNELVVINAFSNFNNIKRLDLRGNKLGFESLVPIKSNPRWGEEQFDLFPQKEFEVEIDTLISVGHVDAIDISTGFPSNTYYMLKDGSVMTSNVTGVFVLGFNVVTDGGVFTFEIRNSNFSEVEEVLTSKSYNVTVNELNDQNVTEKGVGVFSPNGDGISDSYYIKGEGQASFLDKSGRELRVEQLPFEWSGDDSSGRRLEPGLYIIEHSNGEIEKVMIAF